MKPLWIPDAIRKPIPAGVNDPIIVPIGDVFHVAVSEAPSLYDFFRRNESTSGIEATGYIRRDGTIEQYRPLNVECDAQNDGNSFVNGTTRYGFNSWETQGMGDGEWTPQQLAAIKKIILFKHRQYGTPLRQCPDWDKSGFGYHRLFYRWNKHAHSCPGDKRVAQWNHIILPWMKAIGLAPLGHPINAVTFNVRGFPSMLQRRVRHDLDTVRADAADLYFWQEFWLARYRLSLHNSFSGAKWCNYAPISLGGTALTFNTERFSKLSWGSLQLHPKVPTICNARRLVYAVLKDRLDHRIITAASAHLTPAAFSHRLDGNPKLQATTRAAWHRGIDNLVHFATEQVKLGHRVIIGIDANAHHEALVAALPTHIEGLPVKVVSNGLDKPDHIILIGRWEVDGRWEMHAQQVYSDHNPFRVNTRGR